MRANTDVETFDYKFRRDGVSSMVKTHSAAADVSTMQFTGIR